jgi:hypothetical protein
MDGAVKLKDEPIKTRCLLIYLPLDYAFADKLSSFISLSVTSALKLGFTGFGFVLAFVCFGSGFTKCETVGCFAVSVLWHA